MLKSLNKKQRQYLEIVIDHIRKVIAENNISREEFEANFMEIYTACHNSYQKYLKGLLTDEDFKAKLAEKTWNKLRAKEA